MKIGFFMVMRSDPQHFLHAASLVRECQKAMPDVEIVQLTDTRTPSVPGVTAAVVLTESDRREMLAMRLAHYAACDGEWLLIDTDVSVRMDVRHVFEDEFDVALCDRNWPHLPQPSDVLETMPFNTGVVFSRQREFWRAVLAVWQAYPKEKQDWLSEQRAVAEVVKSGRFHVKVLDGNIYNYPPKTVDDPCHVALAHYKGPRKAWLSEHARKVLSVPVEVMA